MATFELVWSNVSLGNTDYEAERADVAQSGDLVLTKMGDDFIQELVVAVASGHWAMVLKK